VSRTLPSFNVRVYGMLCGDAQATLDHAADRHLVQRFAQ
jgi:hypothetical protein